MRLENRAPDNNFSAGLIRERDHSENGPLRKTNNTYDIHIPIHNAYEYVKQCIESVVKYTPPIHSLFFLMMRAHTYISVPCYYHLRKVTSMLSFMKAKKISVL